MNTKKKYEKNTIGIIGYGRFGSLIYDIFSKRFPKLKLKVSSRKAKIDNKKYFSLKDVSQCEIILPCVPISAFEEVIQKIVPYLSPGSLVIDICSVKVHPVKIMEKYLSESIDILATHPMFGPDSTEGGKKLKGLKLIYKPIRIKNKDRARRILYMLKTQGLVLLEMSPEEHDKQAAYTHAFAFLIGKIGIKLNVRKNQISTKGFEVGVLYNQEAVENDTPQLFHDMQTYNPYTKEMRANVKDTLSEIESSLKAD